MSKQTSAFPPIDPLSLEHQKQTAKKLREKISQAPNQHLPFNQFMDFVLYEPGYGYYSAGNQKFGPTGDFITAPESSMLFGTTLAEQIVDYFSQNSQHPILEFGAGSGKLALDLLRTLNNKKSLPKKYYILEVSPELQQRQQQFLEKHLPNTIFSKITWLNQLPKNFQGVMIANEVLDAMPCHRFKFFDDTILEANVIIKEEQFHWQYQPASKALQKAIENLEINFASGYTSEIHLLHKPWIRSLSESLESGLIILIDYGYPRAEFYHSQRRQGTLQCFFRHHKHDNPLILTGIQDITAHVDFTTIAEAAFDNDLEIEGYIDQGNFLLNCGITEILDSTHDEKTLINLKQQLKRLVMPDEMGELFKVMILSRNNSTNLRGFCYNNRLQYL